MAAEPAPPRASQEEQRSFEFADPALAIECVAAEPLVISPVAIAWDAQGRLFVAEMRDYPNANTGGTIRLLEDRDQDGRYETAVVFADGLRFPNSVLPWNGGVLVTAAPDLLFLKDTDGDGKADERRVLFTGFGTGNQQLRVNGLTWGIDGWIYGCNGRSDGSVRRPDATNAHSLRGRDFRFRPGTGEFETLAGRCQFGLAMNDWGERFLSWNTIPIRHEVFSDRYLAEQAYLTEANVVVDLLPPSDNGRVFPLTPAPLVFNNESSGHFNALAGLTIYRGQALGRSYYGDVFVGETLRNLVHRRVLVPAGPTYIAQRGELGTEFLRSTDPWFHPVNFATAADGTLWVVDFYRQFVEHPDFVPREMRERVAWRTGGEHGRLWRITRKEGRVPRPPGNLAKASTRQLLQQFNRPDSWPRETAQRLLVERRDPKSIRPLQNVARGAKLPEARVLALSTLALLNGLEERFILEALRDSDARVRVEGLRVMEGLPGGSAATPELLQRIEALAHEADERVRMQAALTLGSVRDAGYRERILNHLLEVETNRWVRLAAIGSSRALTKERVEALWPRTTRALKPKPVVTVPTADPDRKAVIERFGPALKMAGERGRGAVTFGKLCLSCHYLQGHGVRVGPDLSGIASRPPEALLTDLLDPSQQVAPDFAAYEIELVDGSSVVGLFSSETETRLTIRRAGAPDENIPRANVRSVRALAKSLMPDGLEAGLTPQDMADLIAFLRNPDGELLR
jgi:putative membrane-bound dehydrogenase-like protein